MTVLAPEISRITADAEDYTAVLHVFASAVLAMHNVLPAAGGQPARCRSCGVPPARCRVWGLAVVLLDRCWTYDHGAAELARADLFGSAVTWAGG